MSLPISQCYRSDCTRTVFRKLYLEVFTSSSTISVWTASKLTSSTSTTIKINSLSNSLLLLNIFNPPFPPLPSNCQSCSIIFHGSKNRLTDAAVLLSGQQPYSLSLQVHPSWAGPKQTRRIKFSG